MTTRRAVMGPFVAAIAATVFDRQRVLAQHTAQEVTNGLQVTATGDVRVDQAASGQQDVGIFANGVPITEDGVYRTSSGQLVVNDGQITATGDVTVTQSASGQQTVRHFTVYDGQRADRCEPGHVLADPNTGLLYYQANDCCYYLSPCCQQKCKGKGC